MNKIIKFLLALIASPLYISGIILLFVGLILYMCGELILNTDNIIKIGVNIRKVISKYIKEIL